MVRHIGITQIGLPSRESPYIKPLTGQSWWHIGMQQIGGFATPIKSSFYKCTSILRSIHKERYRIVAILAKVSRHKYLSTGYNYTSNYRELYKVYGGVGQKQLLNIVAKGKKSLPKQYGILVNGISGIWVFGRQRITGLLQANYRYIYKVTSTLQQEYKRRLFVTGLIHANYTGLQKIVARLFLPQVKNYKVIGLLGYGYSNIHKTTGILSLSAYSIYTSTGKLANTIGNWFVQIKGKINIAAFVTEVPKRTQEFITNKNWFK